MENQKKSESRSAAAGSWKDKIKPILHKTGKVLSAIWKWIYRLRGAVLAIPVAIAAISLAIYNTANLPELVGINLQANGAYAMMVERGVAVGVPLLITGICLVLMFISRKTVYPWLISVFSLALPLLIYFTNVFPG